MKCVVCGGRARPYRGHYGYLPDVRDGIVWWEPVLVCTPRCVAALDRMGEEYQRWRDSVRRAIRAARAELKEVTATASAVARSTPRRTSRSRSSRTA